MSEALQAAGPNAVVKVIVLTVFTVALLSLVCAVAAGLFLSRSRFGKGFFS